MSDEKPENDPSGYGKPSEPPSKETLAEYVWGVFKDASGVYANTYHKDMAYPTMVKGNLTREEAEKFALSVAAAGTIHNPTE